MNEQSLKFLKYLQSDIYATILACDKIKIHVKTVDLFYGNINSDESICNFFLTQQDETKNLLKIEFDFSDDYHCYIIKFLPSIKDLNDDKFDILTNKNSNFFILQFQFLLTFTK